jgi:uncharacterized membrane protein YdbT with pleckstrin-like domain
MINLREQESVVLLKRRHLFVLIKSLIPVSLVFLLIVFLMIGSIFSKFAFPDSLIETFPFLSGYKTQLLALFFLSLSLLICWQMIFVVLANYYLDCWIVTNERTIHTELKALFNRFLSSVPHHRVQDITVSVQGILPTFFRYGDLQIQTAGKFHEFIFKQIPEPYETKEIIFKSQKRYFSKLREKGISPQEAALVDEDNILPLVDDQLAG